MLFVGILASLVIYIITPYLVKNALKIPHNLENETIQVICNLTIIIPILISSSVLLNFLAAYQRFDLISYVRGPIGLFTFIGPALVLQATSNMVYVCGILIVIKSFEFIGFSLCCIKVNPAILNRIYFDYSRIRILLSNGGWITISNTVGATMNYVDRFLIGSMISINSVAYYATPCELVTRLMILPSALVGVLFPAFCATYSNERQRTIMLFNKGLKYTLILVFPFIFVIVTLAFEVLDIWLGSELAINSTRVLQWLTIGALINSLSYIPFALVQAAGRLDFTGKLYLIEMPFYVLIIYLLVSIMGIEGAAIAWVIRVSVDTLILIIKSQKLLSSNSSFKILIIPILILIVFLLISAVLPFAIGLKIAYVFMGLLTYLIISWLLIFDAKERKLITIFLFKIIYKNRKNDK